MTRTQLWLIAIATLALVRGVAAQDAMTDLIPHRAAAAVTIRNLDELKKKGDRFVKECDLNSGPLRPSDIFGQIYDFLGLQGGINEAGPAAIILLPPEKEGQGFDLFGLEKLLLGAIPVADVDKLAASFELEPGQLKPNKITEGKGKNFVKFVLLRGKHLYVASAKRALERVAEQKTVSQELGKDQVKSWNEADLLVHIGAKEWAKDWTFILNDFARELKKHSTDPDDQRTTDQLLEAMVNVRYVAGAVRLDEGFGLNITTIFNDAHRPTMDFLKSLQPGVGSASLKGLPPGRAILANANHGDGAKTGRIVKALLHQVLNEVLQQQNLFSAADQPNFVGIFSEVWGHLKGHRAAVYLSGNETKQGLFSLLAILDTADSAKFISDMKTLAKMAEGTLDPAKKEDEKVIDFDKLIKDLGSEAFRLRESATNRLRLVGEPALPYLEKVLETADLETTVRAKRLKHQITTVAAERRKELLAKDLPKRLRPILTFVPKAEMRGGQNIDIVHLKLTNADKALPGQLKQLLGPEWDRIRLARHGNQVVALLGSDVELLDACLDHLAKGKAGLAESPALSQFHKHAASQRVVDFHLSIDSLLGLITPGENPQVQARPNLSSVSVGIGADRLQFQVFVPYGEIRTLKKRNPFLF